MKTFRTHYDNLKVARDAPDIVIRAAYKSLSQRFHPDKNPGDERAARVMALINQSYDILCDPKKRRDHDAWIEREEARLRSTLSGQGNAAPIPPQWQAPQPPPQADKSGGQNILTLVLLWPFKLTLKLIQAAPRLVFLGLIFGGFALYDAVTPDPPPPPGPKPYQASAPADVMPPAYEAYRPNCKKLESTYPLYRCENLDGSVTYSRNESGKSASSTAASRVAPDSTESEPVVYKTPDTTQSAARTYVKPTSAPNGKSWPKSAGYVKGYPIANTGGLSNVTVDNSQNNSDVFVKLVSLDGDHAYPVRQFYISAFGSFTVNKVTAGNYDIRYRDLDTGGLSRSEAFSLEENPTESGVQYSNMTMTLYKVQDGNMETFPLAESEF